MGCDVAEWQDEAKTLIIALLPVVVAAQGIQYYTDNVKKLGGTTSP
jgi:hypothetical protein